MNLKWFPRHSNLASAESGFFCYTVRILIKSLRFYVKLLYDLGINPPSYLGGQASLSVKLDRNKIGSLDYSFDLFALFSIKNKSKHRSPYLKDRGRGTKKIFGRKQINEVEVITRSARQDVLPLSCKDKRPQREVRLVDLAQHPSRGGLPFCSGHPS